MTEAHDGFLITVAPRNEEYDGDLIDVSKVAGLSDQDLPELQRLLPGTRLSTRPGEIGKGASGPGITLVVEALERITNDGASLLAWGALLLQCIRRLRRDKPRTLNLDDPRTIAAVTAAQIPLLHDRLAGSLFIGSNCLTGGGAGLGSDLRDVWASSFMTNDGWVLMLFSSPSGLVLGHAAIPSEWSGEDVRSPEQVRELFEQARRA